MAQPNSPTWVGEQFISKYYDVLERLPKYLNRFYKEDSTFGVADVQPDGNTVMVTASGTLQEIEEKVMATIANAVVAGDKSLDAQFSQGGGVLLQVSGRLTLRGVNRKFVQTFFLATQEKGYYVLNDLLRIFPPEPVCDMRLMENGFVAPHLAPIPGATFGLAPQQLQLPQTLDAVAPAAPALMVAPPAAFDAGAVPQENAVAEPVPEQPAAPEAVPASATPAPAPVEPVVPEPAPVPVAPAPPKQTAPVQPPQPVAPAPPAPAPAPPQNLSWAERAKLASAAAAKPATPAKALQPTPAPVPAPVPAPMPAPEAPAAEQAGVPGAAAAEDDVAADGEGPAAAEGVAPPAEGPGAPGPEAGYGVYVQGLPQNMTKEALAELLVGPFSQFGPLVSPKGVNVVMSPRFGLVAYVYYQDEQSRDAARESSGKLRILEGEKPVNVQDALKEFGQNFGRASGRGERGRGERGRGSGVGSGYRGGRGGFDGGRGRGGRGDGGRGERPLGVRARGGRGGERGGRGGPGRGSRDMGSGPSGPKQAF